MTEATLTRLCVGVWWWRKNRALSAEEQFDLEMRSEVKSERSTDNLLPPVTLSESELAPPIVQQREVLQEVEPEVLRFVLFHFFFLRSPLYLRCSSFSFSFAVLLLPLSFSSSFSFYSASAPFSSVLPFAFPLLYFSLLPLPLELTFRVLEAIRASALPVRPDTPAAPQPPTNGNSYGEFVNIPLGEGVPAERRGSDPVSQREEEVEERNSYFSNFFVLLLFAHRKFQLRVLLFLRLRLLLPHGIFFIFF